MNNEGLDDFRQIQDLILKSFSFKEDISSYFNVYLSKRLSQILATPLRVMRSSGTRTKDSLIHTEQQGVTFSLEESKFFITSRVWIRCWIKVISLFIVLQVASLWPIRKRFLETTKFNLIFSLTPSQIFRNGSTAELLAFLKEPRFKMDSKFDFFLIEGKLPMCRSNRTKGLIVTRNIPIYIARNFFGYRDRFNLFLLTFSKLFLIYRSMKSSPIILLGFNALFEESIYELFFRDFPNATLITTPSQLTLQSFAFEIEPNSTLRRRILLWYATNSIPFEYSNPNLCKADESIYSSASIDEQWVWTEEHGAYLSRLNQKPAIVKGSMMFYSRELFPSQFSIKAKKILLFDVTPTIYKESDETMYSLRNMQNFVSDVVDVVKTLEGKVDNDFEILLKPKRKYARIHSTEYADLLDKYRNANRIQIIDPETNIYSAIQNTDIVISIPFTSPAIIANEMCKPTCYYTGMKGVSLPGASNGIQVITSTRDLRQFLVDSLGLCPNLVTVE